MRLWHKDLISVLPRQQLLAQWRECCCIARNIAVKGTPNHILVNVVLEYRIEHFITYCAFIYQEMLNRDYKVKNKTVEKLIENLENWSYQILKPMAIHKLEPLRNKIQIYPDWHNDRYLTQCFYNLQEKYDRGGIPADEWKQIEHFYFNARKNFKREVLK